MSRTRPCLALALLALLALLAPAAPPAVADAPPSAAPVRGRGPVEDYAAYRPQTHCHPAPRRGTRTLARWLTHRSPGTDIVELRRACDVGGTSEHKEGRALDWGVDVTERGERRDVRRVLRSLFATDAHGHQHALARRMGIMYLIWDDHIYASYERFAERPYLSSSCPSRRHCSATLRHRNHLHVSLSRAGGKGRTSWYAGRRP
jgi:hypothetical protein